MELKRKTSHQKNIQAETEKAGKRDIPLIEYVKDFKDYPETKILKAYFTRNGCIRKPALFKGKAPASYKKGFEVRITAYNEAELKEIQDALDSLDFSVANTYQSGNRIIQPVYGYPAACFFDSFNKKKKQKVKP